MKRGTSSSRASKGEVGLSFDGSTARALLTFLTHRQGPTRRTRSSSMSIPARLSASKCASMPRSCTCVATRSPCNHSSRTTATCSSGMARCLTGWRCAFFFRAQFDTCSRSTFAGRCPRQFVGGREGGKAQAGTRQPRSYGRIEQELQVNENCCRLLEDPRTRVRRSTAVLHLRSRLYLVRTGR